MKVEDDFHLHEGATADIQLFSNAGAVNRTVELTNGDSTKPRLKAGSTLALRHTDQPVNFDDAAETLDAPTRANIKRFLIGLDAALKGRGKDFDRTLRHSAEATDEVANLLAQVNSDGESLKTLVGQGAKVTSALAASPGDLAATADRTASLLSVTAGRQDEIRRSVDLLGPALTRTATRSASSPPRRRGCAAWCARSGRSRTRSARSPRRCRRRSRRPGRSSARPARWSGTARGTCVRSRRSSAARAA